MRGRLFRGWAAILLFHRQFQRVIKLGMADESNLTFVLSRLIHLDPFTAMDSGELGFSWIAEILNSGYGEEQRERMASEVVQSLGKRFFRAERVPPIDMEPTWIPSLLGFLSLGGNSDTTWSSGFIALRILATSRGSADFGPMLLPVLCSTLLLTNRPHVRRLALNVFLGFMPGWFSPKMESVPSEDLNKFVQAVGDPFEFPNLPLQDGKPVHLPDYDPTRAMAFLVEFASLDLWRNHLCRSNFTSFEEILSTWDGKKTALGRIWKTAVFSWPGFLRTAAKITMAIGRLEELQCLNTAEIVIMWAWTVGVVNPADRDGWQLIGRDTLRFYQNHGMERLTDLKRHVAGEYMPLLEGYGMRSGVDIFIKLPALELQPNVKSRRLTYVRLSRACLLRSLYQLFGCDPTTKPVAVEEGDGGMEVSPGRSVPIASFMDWACDYP